MSEKDQSRTSRKIANRASIIPKCDCCGGVTDLISEEGGLKRFVCLSCRRKILSDRQGVRIYLSER